MNKLLINTSISYTGTTLTSGGQMQGALYYNDHIYQFGDGGYCQILDMEYNRISSFRLPAYADNTSTYPHCSAIEWIIPGQKIAVTTNATSLVNYADKVYVYDITDTNNITQDIVVLDCTDKTKYARMACMAYDQTNKIMYVAGYTSGSSKVATSTCWFEAFDFSDYVDNGTLTASRVKQTESDGAGLHLQDGCFNNGYIYYLCDNSNTTNSSYDGLYIWVLDTNFNNVAVIDINSLNTSEAESFFIQPSTNGITCFTSVIKNGAVYYETKLIKPDGVALLTLKTTTNVIGYTINGVEYTDSEIELFDGSYTITPMLKDGSEFFAWSDGDTNLTKTIRLTTIINDLSAKAVRKTIYVYGLPPMGTTAGLSVSAAVTTNLYLMQSTNNTYPNEYVLATTEKYNDEDSDITTQGISTMDTSRRTAITNYFANNSIVAGDRFFPSIPSGCNKFKVTFYNADGTLYSTFNSRNPNIIMCFGEDYNTVYKVQSADVYRPITNEATYDLSSIRFSDGTKAVEKKNINILAIRMDSTDRSNDGYVKIEFFE